MLLGGLDSRATGSTLIFSGAASTRIRCGWILSIRDVGHIVAYAPPQPRARRRVAGDYGAHAGYVRAIDRQWYTDRSPGAQSCHRRWRGAPDRRQPARAGFAHDRLVGAGTISGRA